MFRPLCLSKASLADVLEFEWGLLPPIAEFEAMRVDVVVIGAADDVRSAVGSFEAAQVNKSWVKKFSVQRSMSAARSRELLTSIERRAGVKITLSPTEQGATETEQATATAKLKGVITGPYLRVLYADPHPQFIGAVLPLCTQCASSPSCLAHLRFCKRTRRMTELRSRYRL